MTLLRRHRLANGMTQTALAKRLKLSPSSISLWESGECLPKPRLIPKIARIFHVDPMELTRIIAPDAPPPGQQAK